MPRCDLVCTCLQTGKLASGWPGHAHSNSGPLSLLHRRTQLLMHLRWNLTWEHACRSKEYRASARQIARCCTPPSTDHMTRLDGLALPGRRQRAGGCEHTTIQAFVKQIMQSYEPGRCWVMLSECSRRQHSARCTPNE